MSHILCSYTTLCDHSGMYIGPFHSPTVSTAGDTYFSLKAKVAHKLTLPLSQPQVRYIVDALPVMLESGTKHMALPQEVYGCPYPPVPGQPPGSCSAPQTCNCHRGICYGSCRGGLAGEQRRM